LHELKTHMEEYHWVLLQPSEFPFLHEFGARVRALTETVSHSPYSTISGGQKQYSLPAVLGIVDEEEKCDYTKNPVLRQFRTLSTEILRTFFGNRPDLELLWPKQLISPPGTEAQIPHHDSDRGWLFSSTPQRPDYMLSNWKTDPVVSIICYATGGQSTLFPTYPAREYPQTRAQFLINPERGLRYMYRESLQSHEVGKGAIGIFTHDVLHAGPRHPSNMQYDRKVLFDMAATKLRPIWDPNLRRDGSTAKGAWVHNDRKHQDDLTYWGPAHLRFLLTDPTKPDAEDAVNNDERLQEMENTYDATRLHDVPGWKPTRSKKR
jgi:hypothetical protein